MLKLFVFQSWLLLTAREKFSASKHSLIKISVVKIFLKFLHIYPTSKNNSKLWPANHAHKSYDLNTVEYNNQYKKHKIATNC